VGQRADRSQRLATGSADYSVRLWPGGDYPEMFCAKLTSNMSREHWREWVSPDIDYIPACPDLPIPSDDEPVGTLAGPVSPQPNSLELKAQA
jgi:hypothetical protein